MDDGCRNVYENRLLPLFSFYVYNGLILYHRYSSNLEIIQFIKLSNLYVAAWHPITTHLIELNFRNLRLLMDRRFRTVNENFSSLWMFFLSCDSNISLNAHSICLSLPTLFHLISPFRSFFSKQRWVVSFTKEPCGSCVLEAFIKTRLVGTKYYVMCKTK